VQSKEYYDELLACLNSAMITACSASFKFSGGQIFEIYVETWRDWRQSSPIMAAYPRLMTHKRGLTRRREKRKPKAKKWN
jgi:hypothetical protein